MDDVRPGRGPPREGRLSDYAALKMLEAAPKQGTVLVVDDNDANRTLVRAALEDEGYAIVEAADGVAGVAAFTASRPDCILLDVRMPDPDGFEVCRRIRALEGGQDVPVLFLTALRDVETFDRAVLAGGDDFLTKPVRPTELALRVRAALEVRRARAERGELTALLLRQRDEMLRAILQKEQLTSFLVHDLRNPVTGMALAAEVIASDESVPERARDAALRMRALADNLQRMILNLLDVSKGEAGRLLPARTQFGLHGLVRDVLRAFESRALARRVTLLNDIGDVTLSADEMLLRRIVENLVENALRHAPAGTSVRVGAERVEGRVCVRVSDTGPGIPKHLRDRVFDRFFRVDSEAQRSGSGRGLGLAFCKVAVEAHGGVIRVEDAGPGAVLVAEIPDHG